MKQPALSPGTRVVVSHFDGEKDIGEIIEGPVFHQGKIIFKVGFEEYVNWYPVERLRPALKSVPK